MSGKLEGKVALVTGGNSGIGLATAKRFVAEGAHVFITGRRPAELKAAEKEIGGSVTSIQGDVAKLADLDSAYDFIRLLSHAWAVGDADMSSLAGMAQLKTDATFRSAIVKLLPSR
jgi:NAD(P)-dependent dehydrogenase (short-subunit alcohol dehydrogenase family)